MEALNRQLPKKIFWPVGLRAKYRCEYCGFDVLTCAQAYRCASWDHILPKSPYRSLRHAFGNLALACSSCHALKGCFDPGKEEERTSWAGKTDLADVERVMLIQRVRDYLKPMCENFDDALRSARSLVRT